MGTDHDGWSLQRFQLLVFSVKLEIKSLTESEGGGSGTFEERGGRIQQSSERVSEGVNGLGKCSRLASCTKGPLKCN